MPQVSENEVYLEDGRVKLVVSLNYDKSKLSFLPRRKISFTIKLNKQYLILNRCRSWLGLLNLRDLYDSLI